MIPLFGNTNKSASENVLQVKEWVREILGLCDDTTVMVSELRCLEEDCPTWRR